MKKENLTADFTPGKWDKMIQPTNNGLATTINVGPKRIATLSFVGIEETESNARLIVNSPDMYEALKVLANIYDELTETRKNQGGVLFAYNDIKLSVSDCMEAKRIINYITQ